MNAEPFVVERTEDPVVFSLSPDSPAAPFVIQHHPSSLRDLAQLGIIPPNVKLEHLEEAREAAQQVTVPNAVFADEANQIYARHEVPGVIAVPPELAAAREVIRLTAQHLENRGYAPAVADLTARKVVHGLGIGHVTDTQFPHLNFAEMGDLDVQGNLVIQRDIMGVTAKKVTIRQGGWIFPQGSYFLLHCDEIRGEFARPILEGLVPHDLFVRPNAEEIRERASEIAAEWR